MNHDHQETNFSEYVEVNESNPFCSTRMGGGMTMYMDGFRFTLSGNPDAPCINLLFPQWTLHSRGRFFIAMMGVLFFGIAIEGIAMLRARYLTKVKLMEGEMRESSVRVQLVMTLFHGLQACMGYILMLATMTYSIELFTCTLLGLSVGYFISLKYKNLSSPPKATNTNPCCDFLEDELSLNDATDYERISDGNEPADTFGSSVGLEKRRNNVPGSLV